MALAVCYCRHRKDLINEPCQKTDKRENCILVGRTAQFCIENEFPKPITKDNALKILRESEEEGLVQKIFYANLDLKGELDGVCSCCPCCCGTFTMHHDGAVPAMSYSSYLAKVNDEDCIDCGTCVDICSLNVIEVEDAIAVIDEDKCIRCGL